MLLDSARIDRSSGRLYSRATFSASTGDPAFASNNTILIVLTLGSVSAPRYRYSQDRMRSASTFTRLPQSELAGCYDHGFCCLPTHTVGIDVQMKPSARSPR